jgi:ABC-2 type transport system permease protein
MKAEAAEGIRLQGLDLAEALPSYWLVQASHVALGGQGWTGTGWLVVSAWAAAMAAVAARAYSRDTARP